MTRVAVLSALQNALVYTHAERPSTRYRPQSARPVSAILDRLEEDDRDLPAGA